jgi:hypothetical protein
VRTGPLGLLAPDRRSARAGRLSFLAPRGCVGPRTVRCARAASPRGARRERSRSTASRSRPASVTQTTGRSRRRWRSRGRAALDQRDGGDPSPRSSNSPPTCAQRIRSDTAIGEQISVGPGCLQLEVRRYTAHRQGGPIVEIEVARGRQRRRGCGPASPP